MKENFKKVDSTLAILNILRITTDVPNFERWLKKYHHKGLDKEILEGYKFFLITVFHCLIGDIELDYSLGLKEDFTFFRARFKGVPIEEIPNTCEKTIFIKNLWKSTRPLRKAKDWEETRKSINNLKFLLKIFEDIYRGSHLSCKIDKNKALDFITQYYTLIFLNDISRNIPKGYIFVSTIPLSETVQHFEEISRRCFKGYSLTLEFLWYKLLGREMFKKSFVKKLHLAYEIYRDKVEKYIETEVNISQEKENKSTDLLKYKEWIALDYFFPNINNRIIKPQERKIGKDLLFEPLFLIKNVEKKNFTKLLVRTEEPQYMKKRNRESIKKWLDYKLFWYNLEVLSSTGGLFSGVPAFVSILLGLSKISKDKIMVKIFKHPEKGVKGFRYSYGILIPSFGSSILTDYSGWIIFFNCATDFSGFGGNLYNYAKNFIDLLKKEGRVNVEEIEVEIELFKEYLKGKSISSTFDILKSRTPFGVINDLDISEVKKNEEEFINSVKGIFFELIVCLWLNEEKKPKKIHHNEKVNGEEIDIYYLDEEEKKIYLLECTIAIHKDKIEEKIRKIKDKKNALKKKYKGYKIVPFLVVYYKINPHVRELFENNRIAVNEDFKKEIDNLKIPKEWKEKVYRIIEWK